MSTGKRMTYYVKPPLHEGLGTPQSGGQRRVCLKTKGQSLTLRAFFHVFLGVIEYPGPVVSLLDGFMSEGSTSNVVPTVTIMNVLHHASGFLRPEAP